MKQIAKLITIILVTGMLALSFTSLASAKETIEVRNATGGNYVIKAFNSFKHTQLFHLRPAYL